MQNEKYAKNRKQQDASFVVEDLGAATNCPALKGCGKRRDPHRRGKPERKLLSILDFRESTGALWQVLKCLVLAFWGSLEDHASDVFSIL